SGSRILHIRLFLSYQKLPESLWELSVNRATEKLVKTNGPLKQKQTTFSAKKILRVLTCLKSTRLHTYP
ncbi:Pituitary Tumor-Transforming 3 Protein-Like, partial [Manis pentadactyla]